MASHLVFFELVIDLFLPILEFRGHGPLSVQMNLGTFEMNIFVELNNIVMNFC